LLKPPVNEHELLSLAGTAARPALPEDAGGAPAELRPPLLAPAPPAFDPPLGPPALEAPAAPALPVAPP
jgi:hypothetical protein